MALSRMDKLVKKLMSNLGRCICKLVRIETKIETFLSDTNKKNDFYASFWEKFTFKNISDKTFIFLERRMIYAEVREF